MTVISNTTPFIALASVNQLAMNLNLTGLQDLSGLNRHSLDASKTSTADLGDTRISSCNHPCILSIRCT